VLCSTRDGPSCVDAPVDQQLTFNIAGTQGTTDTRVDLGTLVRSGSEFESATATHGTSLAHLGTGIRRLPSKPDFLPASTHMASRRVCDRCVIIW
jgi:hypothetical protein